MTRLATNKCQKQEVQRLHHNISAGHTSLLQVYRCYWTYDMNHNIIYMSRLSQRVIPSVHFKISFRAKFAVGSQTSVKKKKERNCNGCCRYRRFDLQAQRSSTTSQVSFGLFTEAHPRSRFLDVTQRSPKRAGERCVTSKKRLRGRLRYKTLLHSRVTLNKEVNTIEPRKTKGAEQRQR